MELAGGRVVDVASPELLVTCAYSGKKRASAFQVVAKEGTLTIRTREYAPGS